MSALTPLQHVLANGWWIAVAFCILAYIILDGADLGAGIFSLFVVDRDERGAIMQAMAGTWDANETWLVVAGGVLFGSFPFAYGSVLSYLMVPLMVVLWAILTRAVALEYRHLAERWSQRFSDFAFGISSLAATFFGGMCVGAVLQGFPMTHVPNAVPTYVGGAFRFISPFAVWTGIAAVIAVSLSGGLFIRARFERGEPIRNKAAAWTNASFYLALAAVGITVVWSVLSFPWASNNWLGRYFWVWGLFLAAAIASTFMMRRGLCRRPRLPRAALARPDHRDHGGRHVRHDLSGHGARNLDDRRGGQSSDLALHLPPDDDLLPACDRHVQLVPDLGLPSPRRQARLLPHMSRRMDMRRAVRAFWNMRLAALFAAGPLAGLALQSLIFSLPSGLWRMALCMVAFLILGFGVLLKGEYRRLAPRPRP